MYNGPNIEIFRDCLFNTAFRSAPRSIYFIRQNLTYKVGPSTDRVKSQWRPSYHALSTSTTLKTKRQQSTLPWY